MVVNEIKTLQSCERIKNYYNHKNLTECLQQLLLHIASMDTVPENGIIAYCGKFNNEVQVLCIEPKNKLKEDCFIADTKFHDPVYRQM